jgi:AraC-like DNA-binding protein
VSGVSVLARLLGEHGVSREQVIDGSGIHPDDLNRSDLRITPEQELSVIRNVKSLSPVPDIGLFAGRLGHVGVNGKLGMALLCCATPFEALKMAFRYSELTLTFFYYEMNRRDKDYVITLREIIPFNDLLPFVAERELVSVARMFEDITNLSLRFKEIAFNYPKPLYEASYRAFFRCPVRFDAPFLSFVVDGKYIDLPMPKADPVLKDLYENECRELMECYGRPTTLYETVRRMAQSMGDSFPGLETLAARLNMSSRTLRRKLTDENTSYKQILTDIKKTEAMTLLAQTTLSIEAISDKTGYGDASNFYHAFKKWTGITPNEYRESLKKMPQ